MFKWFKKIFGGDKNDFPQENFNFEFQEKNTYTIDEKDTNNMSHFEDTRTTHQELATIVDTGSVMIGNKVIPMHIANDMLNHGAPLGVSVPGLGNFGGKQAPQNRQPQTRRNQQRPLNNQGNNMESINHPQSQPPQGYPQPQYPPQGYPQPQYPPQGYPQPQYPPQGYPQQDPNAYIQPPIQPPAPPQQKKNNYPATEIAMTDGAYHVFIDLAGVSKDAVSVIYRNYTLIVSGTRESNITRLRTLMNAADAGDPIQSSNTTVPPHLMGEFVYQYPFEKMVDETALRAQFENGILYIALPHRVLGESVSVPIA